MAATSRYSKKVFELFVSKVPWTVASKEMREYFGQFGAVTRCFLPTDKDSGFHKGHCWVSYSTEESLSNALHTDPHVLEGAKLQVQRNRETENHRRSTQKNSKDTEYE